MDYGEISKWIKCIQVINQRNADVDVVNPTPLELIGKGRQGAVFKVNDDVCVKVYGDPDDCEREHHALSLGQKTSLLPRIYGKGPNYIMMEMVKGITVREYLQSQPLTRELSLKLIEMLVTFKKIGYQRIDHHKRQIYIQPDGSLKVIDVGRTVWRNYTYPYPRKLLTSLGNDCKETFLAHVKEFAPDLYKEWLHYMHMENLARNIYHRMANTKLPNPSSIQQITSPLLTTQNEKTYLKKLEDLVRKVYKEEWIKNLYVQGLDPEAVKAEIKELLKENSSSDNTKKTTGKTKKSNKSKWNKDSW